MTPSHCLTPLLLAAWLAAQSPAPVEPPLGDRLPALREQSVWGQDQRGGPPSRPGAFAIGNGHAFAQAGLGARASSLGNLVGPGYGGPSFGGLDCELRDAEGRRIELRDGRIRRVLGAGFVVTEGRSERLALRTLTFAPAGEPRIVRVIDVVDLAGDGLPALQLAVVPTGAARANGAALAIDASEGERRGVCRIALGGATVARGGLVAAIAPGTAFRTVLELAFFAGAHGERDARAPELDLDAALRAADATLTADRAAGERATRYDTDLTRLRDLLGDWRITMTALRDAGSGVCVPMLGRRTASLRENNGALLAFLRYGMHAEARGILDYWWRAVRATGRLDAELPLDLEESGRSEPPGGWGEVVVPPAELPSWLVLQHLWYWRATRDAAFVEERWPLIDVCLKRQARRDVLLPFSGTEPWLRGGLSASRALPDDPRLIGDDPAHGRTALSFASGVLYLLAVHAAGDMVDGIDRAKHPEKYADASTRGPGQAYVERAFGLMSTLEKRYWLDEQGWFAPASSPVDDALHAEPLANATLLPLWAGWTFPTGERSRDNLRNSLARLWRDDARIGTTATLGAATGDLQAMLLVALSERDGVRRLDVFDSILDLASPAGEWASVYDETGTPLDVPAAGPTHLAPGIAGVNLDALLFAITGIRHAAVPNWDDDDIRLELRTPHGASYVTVRDTRKDGRRLDIFFRRTVAPLDETERAANEELAPEKRRDPDVPHERVRFVVDMLEGAPQKGYYDVAVNAAGTVFVRFLKPDAPASPDEHDFRRIEEMEFATPDTQRFLPDAAGGPRPTPEALPRTVRAGDARTLVLTSRSLQAPQGAAFARFDTGLPIRPDDLAGLLFDDAGARRFEQVYLDWRYDAALPTSAAPRGLWAGPDWRALLERFAASGGRIVHPGFAAAAELRVGGGAALEPPAQEPDGALRVPAGDGRTLRFALPAATAGAGDRVLRIGCEVRYAVRDGERELLRAGGPGAVPDRDALLLTGAERALREVVVELLEPGPATLWLRTTDADGLPTVRN
ncbi:MAG: hypothetical protein IPM29_05080 [Planctomycetes bacterium]|nr:hypothetical protein [Planctomycetota bacterium]